MEAITIVKVVQQNNSYFLLVLSNQEEIIVHEDILVRYRLLAGKEIDPSILQELDTEGEIHQGYANALNFISYRPRSILEVKEYLKRKEVSAEYFEEIIRRLLEKGYLDDALFAQKWVANRQLLKPKGKYALRAELREKGISTEIIDNVLASIDEEDEREQAIQVARKKMRQWRGKTWHEVQPKILRFLTYKGYGMDAIFKILPQLKAEFDELT